MQRPWDDRKQADTICQISRDSVVCPLYTKYVLHFVYVTDGQREKKGINDIPLGHATKALSLFVKTCPCRRDHLKSWYSRDCIHECADHRLNEAEEESSFNKRVMKVCHSFVSRAKQ